MRNSLRTTPEPAEARRRSGLRFEVLRYGPANGFVPGPLDLRVLPTPHDAVRVIRSQLRASHVLGLPPHEAVKARRRADHGSWIPVLGTLYRGEPCGFVLRLRKGRHLEWNVRPLTYVLLSHAGCGAHGVPGGSPGSGPATEPRHAAPTTCRASPSP
ncbi:hypothetical protein [Streptomyces sp. NPDC060198]|uniref:hypothetical protein n=1 Tax=Streptomyces sp. NPDC060198 TaxID=3347070 RepID=UPI00364E9965